MTEDRNRFVERAGLEFQAAVTNQERAGISLDRYHLPSETSGAPYDVTVLLLTYSDGSFSPYVCASHVDRDETAAALRRMARACYATKPGRLTNPTNEERRERVRTALKNYATHQFGREWERLADGDRSAAVQDFISDLCHLAESEGLDTAAILSVAEVNFEEERAHADG